MTDNTKYFRLHANCIPVSGKKQAAIYDLERNGFFLIPSVLYDVLQNNQVKALPINQIKSFYKNEFDEGMDKWLAFLQGKGFGFFTDEPHLFPPLALQWDSPFIFTNAILEQDKDSTWSLHDALSKLDEIGCPAVEIRFLDEFDILHLLDSLRKFSDSRYRLFIVYLKYQDGVFPELAANLFLNFRRITKLVFHTAPEDNNNIYPEKGCEPLNQAIKAVKKPLNSDTPEIHSTNAFAVNIELFTESLHYHPGFNRKICVDKNGMVKNYIYQEKSFCHIENINLKELANDNRFRELWSIKLDQIEGCKDCCHRYMCVDKAPIVHKEGKYFKENLTCSYLEIE